MRLRCEDRGPSCLRKGRETRGDFLEEVAPSKRPGLRESRAAPRPLLWQVSQAKCEHNWPSPPWGT